MTPHVSRPDSPWPAELARARGPRVAARRPAEPEPEVRPVFVACPSRRPPPPPSPPRRRGQFSLGELLRQPSPTERERDRLRRALRIARDADAVIYGGGEEEEKRKKREEKEKAKKAKEAKKLAKREAGEAGFHAWVKKLFRTENKSQISWPVQH
jgi:ribosomal protein L25 (general stress protein Ctc)